MQNMVIITRCILSWILIRCHVRTQETVKESSQVVIFGFLWVESLKMTLAGLKMKPFRATNTLNLQWGRRFWVNVWEKKQKRYRSSNMESVVKCTQKMPTWLVPAIPHVFASQFCFTFLAKDSRFTISSLKQMNSSRGEIYYVSLSLALWRLERKEESFSLTSDTLLLSSLKKTPSVTKTFIMHSAHLDLTFNSTGPKNCIILFALWIAHSNARVPKEWIASGKGVSCNCLQFSSSMLSLQRARKYIDALFVGVTRAFNEYVHILIEYLN